MKITLLKSCIFTLLLVFALNVSEARTSVSLYIGPAYPSVYGPTVVWVPAHWDHGFFVPGQYVEYVGPPPGAGYIWIGGGYYGHHWHHGHWHHR